MFFKVLAAIVTADALDRRMREQQYRAWFAEAERRSSDAAPPATGLGSQSAHRAPGCDSAAPERSL